MPDPIVLALIERHSRRAFADPAHHATCLSEKSDPCSKPGKDVGNTFNVSMERLEFLRDTYTCICGDRCSATCSL